MWKRAMDYLGLGPDDAYDDDYEDQVEPERPSRPARQPREESRTPRGGYPDYNDTDVSVRPTSSRPSFPRPDGDVSVRRPTAAGDESGVHPRPINQRPAVVPRATNAPAAGEPATVRPRAFTAAQEVADKFKDGQSVIMNLEGTDKETTRRLVDFASGLCYGLNGTMEKVASGVFLLKPAARPGGYDDTGFGD